MSGKLIDIFPVAEESLDAGPEGGPNFAEILHKALPESDHSSCDSHSDRSSNSGEVGILDNNTGWAMEPRQRRRRANRNERNLNERVKTLPYPSLTNDNASTPDRRLR